MKESTSSEGVCIEDNSKELITLSLLIQIWNRLDTLEFSPSFQGSTKRRLYLRDMASLRHDGMIYYSLGGTDRQTFIDTFKRLNRHLQQLFMHSCLTCLQENRFINQSDIAKITQDERGKRCLLNNDDLYRNKRQKTTMYEGVFCFY
jgi:hypothetical protein